MRVVRVESPGPGSDHTENQWLRVRAPFLFQRRWGLWSLPPSDVAETKTPLKRAFSSGGGIKRLEGLKEKITAHLSTEEKRRRVKTAREKLRWRPTRCDTRGKDFSNLTLLPVLRQNRPDKLARLDNVPCLCFGLKSSLFYDFDLYTYC